MAFGRYSEPGTPRRLRLTDADHGMPGRSAGERQGGSDADHLQPAEDAVRHVERALDRVQRRLDNLRKLVDEFGLSPLDDDRPRAA